MTHGPGFGTRHLVLARGLARRLVLARVRGLARGEVKLKLKVHALRHQRRRAEKLHKQLQDGIIQSVPSRDEDMYQRWVTGRLAKDIDEATPLHGYGKLSTGEYLTAPRLDDFLPRSVG